MRARAAALGLIVALALPRAAAADSVDVPALVKVIENQPSDMDRSTWKEKRRDAARKLGQSKDKRAVEELIKLADAETFDIIGEIAIEGLGAIGDSSAVPELQKIAADASRDRSQRDKAKKALAKLGAPEVAPPPSGGGGETGGGETATGGGDTGLETGSGAGSGGGESAGGVISGGETAGASHSLFDTNRGSEAPALPAFEDDTLAAYERLTFAAGTASLGYDSARHRTDFNADVAGAYQKRIERERMAWGWNARAHVVAGLINPEGREQSRGTQIDAQLDGEARFYTGAIYGVGKAVAATQFNYLAYIDRNGPANDQKGTTLSADMQVALGGGYGRLLDVGATIRVRRLARTLDAARALGKPIDAATSKKLQLTWWALRGERSAIRSLLATIAVLREAGILLGEPDPGLTYEILNVLRDTQLYLRPSGFDAQLTIGEGYLRRPADPAATERGRVEQVIAQAGYGSQLDDDLLELSGTAYARMRILAGDMEPSPWAAGATARMRRFTYGEHGDPFGAFDLSGDVGISSDGLMGSSKSLRIGGELGFTYWMNQASGLRLAAQVAIDDGTLFLGAQLQASYGLLDGTFAR